MTAVTIGVKAAHMRRQTSAIEDKKMRAAIYTKDIPGKSARLQAVALRRLSKQRGWTLCEEYVDPPDRKRVLVRNTARIALIDALLKRKHDVILLWKVEMLGIAVDDLTWVLNEVHVMRGIHVIAPGDGIDTTVGDGMATKVIKALAKV